ncbi:MAG: hypothetical protein MJA29_02180 [Candidatus Omnitrophica bacterium]|nr:hypothetical protein [Candidatus Omnitrophota bacterium]
MIFRNNKGQLSKQVGLILAGVIIVMALVAHFIKQGVMGLTTFYGAGPELQRLILGWRKEAEFVIVGKIVGIREKINQQVNIRADPAMSYLIIDVEVEDVERSRTSIEGGLYPGDQIPVYFGWYSPEGGHQYPPTVKQDYSAGNHVRMFLNYDEYRFGFYSPGAYYTIEDIR